MAGKCNDKTKRRRDRLFIEQKGKCHWCSCTMIHWRDVPDGQKTRGICPRNMATLDHLYDRFDPRRLTPNHTFEQRYVIACWECNNKRAQASVAAQPIEIIRAKCGPKPRGATAWSELND